jgi:hypothetical protein
VKQYKIFFCGSHSTGKTTQAMHFLEHHPEYHQVVFERRGLQKKGIITLNQHAAPWDELIIAGDYLKALLGTPAPFISDRSWIDKLAYAVTLKFPEPLINSFEQVLLAAFFQPTDIDKFFYFPITFPLESDNIRSTDKQYQEEVDYYIQFYLNKLQVPYHTIESHDVQGRYLEIRSVIDRFY